MSENANSIEFIYLIRINFGDFCHFAPIAQNLIRAKVNPNKVFFIYFCLLTVLLIDMCEKNVY